MAELEKIAALYERAVATRQVADEAEAAWLDEVLAAVEAGVTWTAVARASGLPRTTLASRAAVYRDRRQAG